MFFSITGELEVRSSDPMYKKLLHAYTQGADIELFERKFFVNAHEMVWCRSDCYLRRFYIIERIPRT
jgi:hypothetical protein